MTDLDRAADFIWLHARLVDRRRFAHAFLGAPAEPVVAAVRAYRNDDGGFGHALEPDIRTPTSQPGAVMHALEFLAEAGASGDSMVGAAADFLAGVTRGDGGVPFVLPTAAEHPRAPWWQPVDESSLTQTGANAAALIANRSAHPWLDGASAFCWERIDAGRVGDAYEALFAVAFLDAVPDGERAEAALDRLGPRLVEDGLVALEPGPPGQSHTPLHYAPWPDCRSRRLFAPDVVARHLDALAAVQQEDGGWTFDWPAWTPAVVHEWRGYLTVRALQVLRANGRID